MGCGEGYTSGLPFSRGYPPFHHHSLIPFDWSAGRIKRVVRALDWLDRCGRVFSVWVRSSKKSRTYLALEVLSICRRSLAFTEPAQTDWPDCVTLRITLSRFGYWPPRHHRAKATSKQAPPSAKFVALGDRVPGTRGPSCTAFALGPACRAQFSQLHSSAALGAVARSPWRRPRKSRARGTMT